MAKAKTETKTVSAKTLIIDMIVAGKTDDQIIAAVKKKIPESGVNAKHCTKYRREALVSDKVGPEYAAVNSKEHREWATDNEAAALKGPHKAFYKEKAAKAKAAAKAKKSKKAA